MIDPVKFRSALNATVVVLEILLNNRQIAHAIGDQTLIRGMSDCLGTVQEIANDPVAWPKLVEHLNGLSS